LQNCFAIADVERNIENKIVLLDGTSPDYQKLLYKPKTEKTTCPEINSVTFTNDPPFDNLKIPKCGVNLETKLYINQNNTICKLDMKNLPNEVTTNCLKIMKEHSSEIDKIVVLIHGFLSNFESTWLHDMKDAIQSVESKTAVIIVGWGDGMSELLSYRQEAGNTRYVAAALFQLMKNIHQVGDNHSFFPWLRTTMYTHCVGHSLGAHVCGLSGKLMDQESNVPKWDRISGMDPAGPLFFKDSEVSAYGFYCTAKCTSAARLNYSDGKIVDVIHTDGIPTNWGHIQYGTMTRIGTVDFYPGTKETAYGSFQPECSVVKDTVASCSHSRSHEYYMASIKSAVCLASRVCDEFNHHPFPRNCLDLLHNRTREVTMGYWWTEADTTPGKYTVEIKGDSPFCTKFGN